MLAGPISIRLEPRPGVALRTGELVSVQVLNRLTGGKWAVGIQGHVLSASSKVELSPGARLFARAELAGGRITLRVLDQKAGPLGELALKAGLAADRTSERILAAFLASGIKIRPESLQQVRRALDRSRLPPQRYARLAALALDKGIDLASPGIDRLFGCLGYGEQGGRRGGGDRRPTSRPAAAEEEPALPLDLAGTGDGEASPLPLFNHLKNSRGHWVVLPFRQAELTGTIRLHLEGTGTPPGRLVLAVRDAGGERWAFVLTRRGDAFDLHAFCSAREAGKKARGKWREVAQKLQNLGVKTDDTIRVDEDFDGFSLPAEGSAYREIDTEG